MSNGNALLLQQRKMQNGLKNTVVARHLISPIYFFTFVVIINKGTYYHQKNINLYNK